MFQKRERGFLKYTGPYAEGPILLNWVRIIAKMYSYPREQGSLEQNSKIVSEIINWEK